MSHGAVLEPTKKTVLDTKEAAILAFCGEGKMALALLRNAIEHNYCGGPALDKDPLWANVRVTEEFGRLRTEAQECQKRFQALLQ